MWFRILAGFESRSPGGVMWCGVMWCDVVWCDVVWCDVVWCDVVWCDVVLRFHQLALPT